ncbi:hypothetical protein AGOR_G00142530 [Albula goreensis]|uniref:KASH5-like coiled-coil domain-containing protein n=1 Tax=Albula goreensis TaxID=1534307 RepID=A0A8T3D9P7_9TELE|nr:hypothetical protein AGOR_G00142530 [Albula goreensis]
MKEAVDSAKQLMEELEETRGSLTEQAKVKAKLETSVKQLEKENEILKYQVEALTNEMSNTSERQIDKEKIIHLSSLLLELQQDMEETRLTLAHKEEVIEKKDFQIEQLESSQAEYSLIVQRSISLCEELKLVQDVTVQELYEETEVVEVVRCPSLPKLSWWQKTQGGLKRRARAAGALSFCLLLPLCVVTTIAPCYYDNPELTCEEILWNAAHRLSGIKKTR